ncbi:MAG TPA: cyclic nucleotide-binding domain-containing protein, partial [Desulfopila sp.]|nr:cyclic nucleotide-binding domain-containing protein [Desulfopila sp.]
MDSLLLTAIFWGAVSAVSLPLGAWAGIRWRPHSKVVSTLMAFGAGALLFALSVELLGHVPELAREMGMSALLAGVGGALTGGVVFDLLNQVLNNRGAFLRNLSNAKEYVARSKRKRAHRVLRKLSSLEAFSDVPPEELADLVKGVHRRSLKDGEKVFEPGDAADEIYFVRRGTIRVSETKDTNGNGRESIGEAFDSFGELGVLTHTPRTTTARAEGDTALYLLERDDLRN